MAFEKNMEQIFDVTPTEVTTRDIIPMEKGDVVLSSEDVQDQLEQDIKQDYDRSRENFQNLIDKGQTAIDDILRIAKESEHPRAFEVAATLIKNVSDVNRELIDLQKRMKEIEKLKNGGKPTPVNVDKAIFVGSTSELNKLLKSKMNEGD